MPVACEVIHLCSSARLCVTCLPCPQLQKRQVKRPGPNNGREFWSCGEHRRQRQECSLIAACVQAGGSCVVPVGSSSSTTTTTTDLPPAPASLSCRQVFHDGRRPHLRLLQVHLGHWRPATGSQEAALRPPADELLHCW